jgi:hypothetical protein
MDPVHNPFRPGAGRRPPLLAGREALLDGFDVACRRVAELGEGDRSWVINGLRGVGKTALLNELLDRANQRSWVTAKVEVAQDRPLPAALSQALVRSLRQATGRHPGGRLNRLLGVLKALTLKVDHTGALSVGIDLDPVHGVADSGRFAEDLAMFFELLGETARDLGIGVLILIDELQEAAAEDLAALNAAIHYLGQASSPLPVLMVGAGLPSLPALLADATSYAERLYDYRPIGLLDESASADALTVPTEERDVSWSPEGLDVALRAARGYPYFIQAVGKHVWDDAVLSPISLADVEVGVRLAREEVDDGLYRSRWERATPAQRSLLRSLAELGGEQPAGIADIAAAMGKSRTSDLSVARNELIKKGLIYAPERGQVAFTVPGMHDFIERQP